MDRNDGARHGDTDARVVVGEGPQKVQMFGTRLAERLPLPRSTSGAKALHPEGLKSLQGMFLRRQFLRRVQVIALTKDVTGRGDHVALLERIHACNRDAPEFS